MRHLLPRIYAIVNYTKGSQDTSHALLVKYLEAEISLIQIRAKGLDKSEIDIVCRRAIEIRNNINSMARIIINDFVDVCKRTNADGVHLGQGDGETLKARKILGRNSIIGLSTHSLDQLKQAKEIEHALSYVALGPIFESTTKKGHADAVGLGTLKQAANSCSLPLVAIGGINEENAEKVLTSGANSIALIAELEKAAQADTLDSFVEKFSS